MAVAEASLDLPGAQPPAASPSVNPSARRARALRGRLARTFFVIGVDTAPRYRARLAGTH